MKAVYLEVDVDGKAEPLSRPEKAIEYMKGAFADYPDQEAFWVVLLNRRNYPRGRHRVSIGTLTSTLAHPREVFRPAIAGAAAAILCLHNHPSGDPSPSAADIQLTRQLREAGSIIDIPMLDHVIVGDSSLDPLGRGYYSFREAGLV